MHTINTFLFGEPNSVSRSDIHQLVKTYFKGWESAVSCERKRPFGLSPSLMITINGYEITVDFIDSTDVKASIAHVEQVTNIALPSDRLIGEVRTIFSDDPKSDFDYVTVSMYKFLELLPNAVLFDSNHNKIISSNI